MNKTRIVGLDFFVHKEKHFSILHVVAKTIRDDSCTSSVVYWRSAVGGGLEAIDANSS